MLHKDESSVSTLTFPKILLNALNNVPVRTTFLKTINTAIFLLSLCEAEVQGLKSNEWRKNGPVVVGAICKNSLDLNEFTWNKC